MHYVCLDTECRTTNKTNCARCHHRPHESLFDFADQMTSFFGTECLRCPNESDLRRILAINASRGFPGCVGSWDCQHCVWDKCPIAWAGQFKGKEKKPTVVLEAIADGELWIWGSYFGSLGSLNDINILDQSPIIQDILHGKALPGFEYDINGNKRTLLYHLVDRIYPNWAIFVKAIAEASSRKHKRFATAQEAMRKDMERAFGVLLSRFNILRQPCRIWSRAKMVMIMKVCIILYNMIAELRHDSYDGTLWHL